MKDLIKQLMNSKKVWATIAAILVWVLGRFQLELAAADLLPIVGAIMTFVAGQALADVGKEAKKLEAKPESKPAPYSD